MPSPPILGLVAWAKGDSGITSALDADGNARLTSWTNQVSPINDHLFGQGPSGNNGGPYVGLETLDGIPCITWRFDVDHTQSIFINDDGLGNPGSMKDRSGNVFGYGVGERQPRTMIAIMTPRFAAGVNNITGGGVAAWSSQPDFEPLFNLEDNLGPNRFYAFSGQVWRDNFANALRAPDTAGGAGGIYNGAPIVGEWSSSGFDDINFSINGVLKNLTPSVIPGPSAGAPSGWVLGTTKGFNDANERWKGSMTEILVYDYKLSDNPQARQQLYEYIASRYPTIVNGSIPFTIPSAPCSCSFHTTGITAFADHLEVTFSEDPILSGPATDPSNWIVTVTGPGRDVQVTSVSVVGDTVHLGVTTQTLNAQYTLDLPTVGITDAGFESFQGLFSLDFLGVPTIVTIQMVKVVDALTLDVIFSVPVAEVDASNPISYSLNNGLAVIAAQKITDFWYRITNKPRQVDGQNYTLTVTNINAK